MKFNLILGAIASVVINGVFTQFLSSCKSPEDSLILVRDGLWRNHEAYLESTKSKMAFLLSSSEIDIQDMGIDIDHIVWELDEKNLHLANKHRKNHDELTNSITKLLNTFYKINNMYVKMVTVPTRTSYVIIKALEAQSVVVFKSDQVLNTCKKISNYIKRANSNMSFPQLYGKIIIFEGSTSRLQKLCSILNVVTTKDCINGSSGLENESGDEQLKEEVEDQDDGESENVIEE